MKKMSALLAIAAIVSVSAANAAEYGKVYNGTEPVDTNLIINSEDGTGCGTLNLNADGSYENGFCWQYGGLVAPYYGAFAECYSANGNVCSVVLDLTQIGLHAGQTADVYVWEDGGGAPGNVLGVVTGYLPSGIAFWPSLSRHVADVSVAVAGNFWAGYWGNWPNGACAWYVGADLDGFGGCPYTNIAPGIGYPTGWQNASIVWGPTQALGIGVELGDGPVPTENTTWGAIKNLYN